MQFLYKYYQNFARGYGLMNSGKKIYDEGENKNQHSENKITSI